MVDAEMLEDGIAFLIGGDTVKLVDGYTADTASQYLSGMLVECDHHRCKIEPFGFMAEEVENVLMANVHTVKHAHRHSCSLL